jgi:hypothetical protein
VSLDFKWLAACEGCGLICKQESPDAKPAGATRSRHTQELIEYLGKRNIAIFSTDMDSFDFKMRKPEQVRQSVMELKKHGKGIVLVHDFQHATAEAAVGSAQ